MNFFKRIFGINKSTETDVDEFSQFSNDELNIAALKILSPLPSVKDSFWGGTLEEADNAQKKCDALKEKYNDYQPTRMRKQIMSWISYAERAVAKNRKDIISQKTRKEFKTYLIENEIKEQKLGELLKLLKIN